MNRPLQCVFEYFGYFSYAPSFDELHIFYPVKISKKNLKKLLQQDIMAGIVLPIKDGNYFRLSWQSIYGIKPNPKSVRYTLPQYSIKMRQKSKVKNQNKAIQIERTVQAYLRLLKVVGLVRFVGVTGASAMGGSSKGGDLDLCLVSSPAAIWMTRFYAVLLAKLLGIHHRNGVCLNLFFDETDLQIPAPKRNSYIAHELLQMKPLIDKGGQYERFIAQNEWIYRYFPNARKAEGLKLKPHILHATCYMLHKCVDTVFKSLQLPIIKRNKTAFFISPTQLWLFKSDFQKKLKRVGLVI